MYFSYPNMSFTVHKFIFTYKKLTSWTKNYCLFVFKVLISLKLADIPSSLTENVKDNISLFGPIGYYLTFISRLELNPIENFAWLIIRYHGLRTNFDHSGTFPHIWLNIRNSSIDPPAQLLRLLLASKHCFNQFIFLVVNLGLDILERKPRHHNSIPLYLYFIFLFYSQIKCDRQYHCLTIFNSFKY